MISEVKVKTCEIMEVFFSEKDENDMKMILEELRKEARSGTVEMMICIFDHGRYLGDLSVAQFIFLFLELKDNNKGLFVRDGKNGRLQMINEVVGIYDFVQKYMLPEDKRKKLLMEESEGQESNGIEKYSFSSESKYGENCYHDYEIFYGESERPKIEEVQ